MKRIIAKLLIACLLLSGATQSVAANKSFLTSTFKTAKSLIGLGVAAAAGALAYRLWTMWNTRSVVGAAQKAVQPARKPIACVYEGLATSDEENKLLAERQCIFTQWEATPQHLYANRQQRLQDIQKMIADDIIPSLCDAQGNAVKGTSTSDIATTLQCDENTIRYNLSKLGMKSLLDKAFEQSCIEVGITKQLREKPWLRTEAQQVQFEQALSDHIEQQLEQQYTIVKTGKRYMQGDADRKRLNQVLNLCKELDRIKTLQQIVREQSKHENDALRAQRKQEQENSKREQERQTKAAMRAAFKELNPSRPLPKELAEEPSAPELHASEIARNLNAQFGNPPAYTA